MPALQGGQLSLNQRTDAHTRVTEEGLNPIAVILRTSGTTARQKLVPVTHYYIASMSNRMKDWFDLAPEDRCFCGAPLFYGHGVMGRLMPRFIWETALRSIPVIATSLKRS